MSSFTVDQLKSLNREAGELLQKLDAIEAGLERIGNRWHDDPRLPSQDELNDYQESLLAITRSLSAIPELWESVPDADDVRELSEQTAEVARNLTEAGE